MRQLKKQREDALDARPTGCRISLAVSMFLASFSLGNVIRFTLASLQYNGFIFVIPYLVCSLLVVWPLIVLEKGLGYLTKKGSINSSTILGHRFQVTAIGPLVSLLMCCYYQFFVGLYPSFITSIIDNPDGLYNHHLKEASCAAISDSLSCNAQSTCVFSTVLNMCVAAGPIKEKWFFLSELTPFITYKSENFIGGTFTFITRAAVTLVICCIGVLLGRPFRVTYLMSVALLFSVYLTACVMCIFSPTLLKILSHKLATMEWSQLLHLNIWISALGQALFSLGLGQGFLINFTWTDRGSTNLMVHSTYLMLSDIIISCSSYLIQTFVLNSALFAIKNAIKYSPFTQFPLFIFSYSLIFAKFNISFYRVLTVFLFLFLWLVSFASVFRAFGSFVTSIYQSQFGTEQSSHYWHIAVPATVCLLIPAFTLYNPTGFRIVLLFDIINCNLILTFTVLLQIILVLWFSFNDRVYERIGKMPVLLHGATWFLGWATCGVLSFYVSKLWALAGGLIIVLGGLILAIMLARTDHKTTSTWSRRLIYLTIFNIENLRWILNGRYCKNSYWRIPFIWTYLSKYVASAFLTFCFFTNLFTLILEHFPGISYDVHQWYNVLVAQIMPCTLLFLASCFLICFPKAMDCFIPAKTLLFRNIVPSDMSSFVEQYYIYKQKDMSKVASLN